uniref:Dopey N-terminal domain-containing protein n=1 Tax=Pygocentrus nattereri TaxID=42514 RepID=A0AAR2L0I9_PYGNA
MNAEEVELLGDSKYRNYVAAVDKALKNFEYSSEWADLISALGKLNKVLQNNAKYQVVPKKLTIGKRLAQCLHPALPSGVHRKALETYEIIFKIIGPKRLAKDLFLYSSGLFPLLSNAAMSVKPVLLGLYETYYLPLGKTLKPGLQGLLTGVLPGLEEGSEYYDRTNTLLEKVAAAVEQPAFYSALWGSILTSPAVRLPGVSFVLLHLNRKLSMEDQLYVMGSDIELMVEAVSTSVQDSSVLVQRSTLDLILFCFPFHMSQATRPDMIRILSAALHVVLRRDMSLNRRLYAWLLGFDNNGVKTGPRNTRLSNPEEHATHYFNTYSKDMLVQAMVGILQGKARGGEEESALMHDLKPFRILISLLDKPELGPAILEDVLIEVFRTLYTQCRAELDLQNQNPFSKDQTQLSSKLRENKKTAELIKTANLLFNSFEPYYMWDYIARWFEEGCRNGHFCFLSCRRTLSGSEPSVLSLVEFCQLVDFLLDIVSLETYIEIQTEHLPQLLLRMVSALTAHLRALCLGELTHCLRLCSKILSKVQPPLVSPLTLPSAGARDLEGRRVSIVHCHKDNKTVPVSEDVFEDRENPASSRSSESGFTDFVQYQGENGLQADPAQLSEGDELGPMRPKHKGSGSAPYSKPQDSPVMQRCLEHFQHFLCSLVKLYIAPGDCASRMDTLRVAGPEERESVSEQKECVAAFTAACQLFLECSSFPVYIAEGNLKSSPTREDVLPPLWLQTLMDACCSATDFSIQAVAISLVMDLVGLTQSVAMVTAERVGSPDSVQPMSPSQGRVAVVIRPPLTQGILKYIAEKTDFFKSVALILWEQLGESTPQHHQRSVELFYQLHNLVPSSSICEDVISQQLMHRDKRIRLEAHVKFSVLWHLTRDLNVTKSSPFSRTFDRSLFIMLDSLSYWDGSASAVGRAWLNQVLQRHDIARVLEPLLLLLLHPKTHRVSIQRVQAQRHWARAFPNPPEPELDLRVVQGRGLPLDDMEPLSLTVNPLSDSLSLLSLSSENLQLCGEYQPPDQQDDPQSSDSSGSQSSTMDNGSFDELDGTATTATATDQAASVEEDSLDRSVSAVLAELLDRVVQMVDDSSAGTPSPPEAWPQTDSDSSNSSLDVSAEPHVSLGPFPASVDTADVEPREGITRHSSSPSIITLPDSSGRGTPEQGLHPDDPQARKRSHSSTQLSLKGKIMERLADKSPGAKPKVKKAKRKEEERRKANQAEKNRPPSIFFGDSLDLENWYSCGEGEVSEIESDVGSPSGGVSGIPGASRSSASPTRFNVHPLYQHVLLYLQLYDSSRTLHALSAVAAMLRTAPAGFVSAISTTSINNTYTPQLSLLQNLLARHRVSVMGKDFYCPIPQDSHSHSFRSAMYLEIVISLCLYFLRSYYSAHVAATSQDLAGNRAMQLTSVEVLTLLFCELAKVTGGSAKGFASFISDVLSKCKVQKVTLHCLLSSIFSAQKWHDQRVRGSNVAAVEEGMTEESIINLSEDQLDGCSAVQSQLLRLLQSLVVLEHHVLVPSDDGGDLLGSEVEHVNPQQPMASLQYLPGQPITAQGMFLCAVIRALHQHHACKMHPQWISLITATLPYMGRVLRRVVASVTLQLCRNLDNLIQQYRYETGLTDTRPQWMALCIPPDLILTVLEGVTAIIHYCLLDPSSQYHQLQVSVDQKHLAEARAGILSILHTIMSSVTLLWSVLYMADSSDRPAAAAACSSSNINLGSTKVIPTASEEQLLLVDLVRSVNAMRTETVMQTVKEVLKQPPAIAKEKRRLCFGHLFFIGCLVPCRIPVSSLVDSWPSLLGLLKDSVQLGLPAPGQFLILGVLNEFILKNPTLESKKDQRELQDVTHKIVEAIVTVAGSSLEQTTWLRRNLEVKPSPQIVVDGATLEADVEDLMLTVMEASNFTPSVYSVHALTLLAEVLAHLLDMVFYSDEKERVIPLLVNIMHYVVPYLRNHSAHNAPSYRACIQLLSSLSGYQYTRRAWKKEAFDLFMDHTFFQMDSSCVSHWRAIIDHLMTHDKTTFRDLMTRVAVAQSSSLNLFTNRDAELEQRAMLLKRLAFTIYSSEVDQYQKYLPDIQGIHTFSLLFLYNFRVQVFLLMEQELIADEDITRTSGPSVAGLETTYSGGNGFSTSYNSQRWLNLYLSACKLLDLALALPSESLPQFQMYRWAFIPEASDDSGLEVRRQGTHQREFKPYVVRLAKLLRKRAKVTQPFKSLTGIPSKNPEEDCSGRPLTWEPGRLTLTLYGIRSMEQLLPFFTLLSQVFSSKASSRSGPCPVLSPSDTPHTPKHSKPESQKVFWSRARQHIEEMVEKDFLEGLIKT